MSKSKNPITLSKHGKDKHGILETTGVSHRAPTVPAQNLFFFFFSPKGKKEVQFFFCFHVRTPENRGAFEFASSHNSFKQIIRRGDPHELLCPSLCSTRASFQFLRLIRPYLLPPFVFSSNFCLLHKVELRRGTKVNSVFDTVINFII